MGICLTEIWLLTAERLMRGRSVLNIRAFVRPHGGRHPSMAKLRSK
jgi:hypothetical protein